MPLWKKIGGGARREIPCGVSIGIQDSVEQLLEKIERELAAGYQRIKIKIKPGWDVDVVRRVRERFPGIKLMADANSAYTLADADHLRKLDDFYLMMIEQPLGHDDIIDHAELQRKLADAHLPGRVHPHGAPRRAGHPAAAPAASSTSSWGAWAASARPSACTTWRRPRAFRCGAAACSKPASAARTTWRWPRCRISCCRATFRPASATGSATSSSRRSKPRRTAPSRCATSRASATRSTTTSSAAITVREESIG